jgi:hypothetical protein
VTVTEGNFGTTSAVFSVTLSAASGQTVSVDYATADNTATSPADYTSASNTLTFPAGTTVQTITITVQGDVLDEIDESYFVNLSNASNASISDNQGVGTITDDDTIQLSLTKLGASVVTPGRQSNHSRRPADYSHLCRDHQRFYPGWHRACQQRRNNQPDDLISYDSGSDQYGNCIFAGFNDYRQRSSRGDRRPGNGI